MDVPGMLDPLAKLTLTVHAASTWAMAGVILVVQIVHYPLFANVGSESFPAYESLHTQKITWVVAPLMLLELGTAIALVVWRPLGASALLVWIGLGLLGAIWLSTAAVQVPLHTELANGFDTAAHRKLVVTNWVRTVAWAARAFIAAALLYPLLSGLSR